MNVSMSKIIKKVIEIFNVPERELMGRSRARKVSNPRIVAMYCCREYSGQSYPSIGRKFYRDHTTVLSAVRAVKKNKDLKMMAHKVRESLNGSQSICFVKVYKHGEKMKPVTPKMDFSKDNLDLPRWA